MKIVKEKVINGAESFFLDGNEIGILLCHGFVGTPQSVREIGEQLHSFGFTVLAPRLKGHGTSIYDLEQATYRDWLKDLESAFFQLKKSCRAIFVVGQSMGGALSLRLAAKFPEVKGVITINAALHVPGYDSFRTGVGMRFITEETPDIKNSLAEEITYDSVPLTAILELQKLLDGTPELLEKVHCPLLVMTSPEDHVVPPTDSLVILEKVSSSVKKQVLLDNSYHVASLDYDKQKIVHLCHRFVTQI